MPERKFIRRAWRRMGLVAAAALTMLTGANAVAYGDDRPAEQAAGGTYQRFTMVPVDGGVLRLDTQTGATSRCARQAGVDACTLLPDGETALRGEIDQLKAENARLKAENQGLKDMAALGAPDPKTGIKPALPTERDVDHAFDYVEGLVKKFRERMKKLDRPDGTPL